MQSATMMECPNTIDAMFWFTENDLLFEKITNPLVIQRNHEPTIFWYSRRAFNKISSYV